MLRVAPQFGESKPSGPQLRGRKRKEKQRSLEPREPRSISSAGKNHKNMRRQMPTNADIGRRQGFRGPTTTARDADMGGGYESRVPRKPRRQMPTLDNLSYSPKHKEPEKKQTKKTQKRKPPQRSLRRCQKPLSATRVGRGRGEAP